MKSGRDDSKYVYLAYFVILITLKIKSVRYRREIARGY